MVSVADKVCRLQSDRDSGALGELCRAHDVDLLVWFGSSRRRPETAGDIDLAYSFVRGVTGDELAFVNALGEAYGDEFLDLMPLDRAGSVARYAALGAGERLFESTPDKFATMQMAAYTDFVDTQPLRDIQLEAFRR